jgi:hypothetical protein
VSTGQFSADVLAVTARRHAVPPAPTPPIPLPDNVSAASGSRPAPSLADYDRLLTGELA